MKKWISLVLLASVGIACLQSFGQEHSKPKNSSPTKGGERIRSTMHPATEDEMEAFGHHTCPLAVLYTTEGISLYEVERYLVDTCDEPFIDYIWGNVPCPGNCSNDQFFQCLPYRGDNAPPVLLAEYKGLPWPVPSSHDHQLSDEVPLKYSQKSDPPNAIRFVKFHDGEGRWRTAKVFCFKINRQDAIDHVEHPDPLKFDRTAYFAMECPPDFSPRPYEFDDLNRIALQQPEADCKVYRLIYKRNGMPDIQILALLTPY